MPLKLLRSLIQENKEKMQEYPLLMGVPDIGISSLILRADPLFRILQKLHFCVGHVVAFFDIMKTQKSIRNYLPMGGPLFVYDECRLKLQDRFATAGPDGVFTGRFDLISYHENDK